MLCRLCLNELDSDFINIFKDDGYILEGELLKCIVKYLEIELIFHDKLSNKICRKCWNQLNEFRQFCIQIQEKQITLLDELTNSLVTVQENEFESENESDINYQTSHDNLYDEPCMDILQLKLDTNDSEKGAIVKEIDQSSGDDDVHNLSFDSNSLEFLTCKNSSRRPDCLKRPFRVTRKCKKSLVSRTSTRIIKSKLQNENTEVDKFIKEHVEIICKICKQEQETFSLLKHHFRKEHNVTGYLECCNTRFKKRFLLVDHIKVHSDPNHFKCKLCDKVLISRNSYNNHMDTIHPPEEKLKFDCNICSKKFTKQYILDIHMTLQHTASEEIQCETCKKVFKSQLSLRQHVTNIHSNVSSIICDLCGLILKSKQNLKYHMSAIHEIGEIHQQVQCNLCGNWLANERSLQKHMYRHRDEASEKTFPCQICGENKSTRVKLAAHIRYHHSDRSFICTLCNKHLKSQISLNEHMATHTGKDLYTCPFCPRTFKSHANMHNHKKKMHSEKLPPKKAKELFKSEVDSNISIKSSC